MIFHWIKRAKALRHVNLLSEDANFFTAGSVSFDLQHGSVISVKNGTFHFGFPLPETPNFSSYPDTILSMGKNAKLTCNGNVFIAPGASIRIGDNAEAIFEGNNYIAHNFFLMVTKKASFGLNASISWNVSMIDDDRHPIFDTEGKRIDFIPRPLIIGSNVGIQMQVIIPKGVTIGDNSAISAGTVLRQDVPEDSLVFTENQIKVKAGYRTGFGQKDIRHE